MFFCFFFPVMLFCDWVGCPSLPAILQQGAFLSDRSLASFRSGIEGSYVFNEKLCFARKERSKGLTSLHVEGISFFGLFLMNLKERIEFYLEPGTIEYRGSFRKEKESFSRKTGYNFAGKAGSRAIVLEIKDTSFGVDVHYRFFNGYVKDEKNYLYHDLEWTMREWQIGVGVSQKIQKIFYPYVGLAIRQSKQKIPSLFCVDKPRLRANQRHKKGLYCGFVVSKGALFLLGVEAHFYHETSITGCLQFRM